MSGFKVLDRSSQDVSLLHLEGLLHLLELLDSQVHREVKHIEGQSVKQLERIVETLNTFFGYKAIKYIFEKVDAQCLKF